MKALKSTLIVLLLGLTTVGVVGLLLLNLLLPTLLQKFACTPYGIRCAIGQAGIRPHSNMTADLVIGHLVLFDPDGRGVALRVKHLTVTLDIPGLLFAHQVMPTDIQINNPTLTLRQLDGNRWNLPAMVQEAQRHLQPAAQPKPWQFPRLSVAGGTLQFRAHQVTDVHISLDPKPAPLLFEVQARAAVGGQPVTVSAVLNETFEGQVHVRLPELLPNHREGEVLRGALRFRWDRQDDAVAIPEWSLETDGALVRGMAVFRYHAWPPVYTLAIAQWHADLGALARRFSLSQLSSLTGLLEGRPSILQGSWPDPPDGLAAATLKEGALAFPTHQSQVIGLTGGVSLRYAGGRLRIQSALDGKTVELFGRHYANPSLQLSVGVDPLTGDLFAEELRASIADTRIRMTGGGRRWGRDGVDLTTTNMSIEPAVLAQLSGLADAGVTITRLSDPAIQVRWLGAGRPWKATIRSRAVQLHTPAVDLGTTLHNAEITVLSERDLEGRLAVERVDLHGRRLRSVRARFEFGHDDVRIPAWSAMVGDGEIRGRASLATTPARRQAYVTLSIHSLQPQALSAAADASTRRGGVTIDAELSADAAFGQSSPLAVDGRVTIRHLSLRPARGADESTPPMMRVQGSIPFALDKGLLTIAKTTLHEDGGTALTIEGSLSPGRHDGGIRLSVPWTEVSTLRTAFAALTNDRPETTRLSGQFRVDAEVTGDDYRGMLAVRNVDIESRLFRMDGATGTIPLYGRTGRQNTAEPLSALPTRPPAVVSIASFAHDPVVLRNIELGLDSSDGRIAIRRFTFDALGGRWSGWGTLEPLSGGIALTVLTDGLSLRAICDAFQPIKGYISGLVNGRTDLSIPGFALDQASGKARFWVIDSPREGRKISRALIERLAGQHIRYFSLFGLPRRYDRGVLDVTLKAGDLIFHELEISHTTLGSRDLDVRVSPTFNKIGLAHLLNSIGEAITRITASGTPNS